jgi:(p)ppGpp synthase/HD superfamily hydrolase
MERNTLELVRNSLFIEKIKNASQAAKAVRLVKVCSFSKQRTSGLDSVPLQAAEPLIDLDADAISVAGALLAPFLWKGRAQPDEIPKLFGKTVADTISDLNSRFILLTDTENHRRMDTHTLLESLSGPFRKKVRQKTPSQGKFP